MRYSDDIIEEVRQKNDIVDVVSQYVRLTRRGSTYFGLCPFHNEKTPSFSVTPGKQMYYCFGCGAGGNAITFLMEYENYSFPEALQVLADRAGVELPKEEMTKEARAQAVAEMQAELDRAKEARDKADDKRRQAEASVETLKRSLEERAKTEKKAVLGADKDLAQFELLFQQAQETANKMHGILLKVRSRDEDAAGRLVKALQALAEAVGRCAE